MIYKGNPVSAGIAIGSAFVYDPKILTAPEDAPVLPMECELERYENAVQAAQAKLREIQAAFTGKDDDIRALRLCFENEDIMRTQLRAALRASVYGTLWLMFPMVSGLEDFTKARIIVLEEKERLWQSGVAVSDHIKLGVMIETPAAVMMADQLAKQVDFASIGSNDLCQYLTAADRMNPAVAQYCRSSHPAIYRAIAMTIQAFRKENKPLSICGELGGDKNAACVLVGMGMRKLSMSIHAVPGVKQMLWCWRPKICPSQCIRPNRPSCAVCYPRRRCQSE